jgi:hypothetical protein
MMKVEQSSNAVQKPASLRGALALLAVLGFIMPMNAAAQSAVNTGAALNSGVDFNIRFFDRRIYYAENDPINIQVTITNNSPSTYRFKLADERVFSLDFDVRTVTNRPLEPADALVRKRTQYQRIFFREIAVEAGEAFSFVENLRDYVKISQPGSFVVQARVYPELLRFGSDASAAIPMTLESKRLSLSIWPPLAATAEGIPLEMDVATGAVLVRQRLAPDQVVDYMIDARQKSQWEKFYLYLDLEEMLAQDGARQRRWLSESEEGRKRMVDQYRQELKNSSTDGISVIPTDYTIEMTQYTSSGGTVTVLEKFKNTNFTELKRYTYYLRFKDNIWTIAGYSVTNLGTE